jgi:hypothetical protein
VRAPGEDMRGFDDKQVAAWPELKGVMTVGLGPGTGHHPGAWRASLHHDTALRVGAARVVYTIGRASRDGLDDAEDHRGSARWPRNGRAGRNGFGGRGGRARRRGCGHSRVGHASSAGHGHEDNGRRQQPPEVGTYRSRHCHLRLDGPAEFPVPLPAGNTTVSPAGSAALDGHARRRKGVDQLAALFRLLMEHDLVLG